MKKIISLLLFVFTGILMADQIDIAVSEGTDQRVVETLIPQPAEVEADANVTIKAIFSKALNPMTVRRSVMLKKLNKEKQKSFFGFFKGKRDERVSGKVSYDANSYTVSFKPDNPLEVGFYEVSFRHLMTRNPGRDMRIKPITYRFYVPEVINGFKLPPEPDEDKNNETLLGIDFNHNGIRDDVERTIIKKYNDKIKVNLMFQYARIDQKILGSELTKEKALELEAEGGKAINCEMYLSDFNISIEHSVRESEELTYNIKKRAKKYIEYNRLLGGGVYGSKVSDWNADACEFDVESMLEERQ